MVIKIFDYGWGPEWAMKSLEAQIIKEYLAPLIDSNTKIVIINSTWYGQEQHAETLEWLRNNEWDSIVLVAMIDSAIPTADWFQEFGRPVYEVGHYNNEHYISFWAEVVSRHIEPFKEHDIDIAFMCLNRKPHWHRLKFYREMETQEILDLGLVSLGSDGSGAAIRELRETVQDNMLAPNGQKTHHGIPNDITSLGDLSNWRRHFLNVVTETVYNINQHHFVSEKIFKPILGCRPFLVYDADGASKWMKDRGFEPYVDDFRDISELDLKDPSNLAPFLKLLCQQPKSYWRQKYVDLLPKINYNLESFNRFINKQRQHISKGIPCQI